MAKSIMHRKADRTCYLCMLLHHDRSCKEYLEEHHVMFGTANRALSEKYGLKIYLCFYHHNSGSPEAVHQNTEIRRMTERAGQQAFNATYPNLSFREIFGKNIPPAEQKRMPDENPKRQQSHELGFEYIETGIGELPWN